MEHSNQKQYDIHSFKIYDYQHFSQFVPYIFIPFTFHICVVMQIYI